MAPSDDKEALFHINDIRFGYAGKNILCVSCFSKDKCATQTSIDSDGYRSNMKKAYDTEFIKSENITAFMTVRYSCFGDTIHEIFFKMIIQIKTNLNIIQNTERCCSS